MSGASNTDINFQLDKVYKQLSKLSAALLSSTSGSSNESEVGVVDAVMTVGVVAEDVASVRNNVGTAEEIIIS